MWSSLILQGRPVSTASCPFIIFRLLFNHDDNVIDTSSFLHTSVKIYCDTLLLLNQTDQHVNLLTQPLSFSTEAIFKHGYAEKMHYFDTLGSNRF